MTTIIKNKNGAPDLSEFRRRYPLTVAQFGSLGNREKWLRGIWQEEVRWHEEMEEDGAREVIVREAPPARLPIVAEFDVIYAGGSLGLLHAAVMAACYKRRVMVFDEGEAGRTGRGWNISDEDLRELERVCVWVRFFGFLVWFGQVAKQGGKKGRFSHQLL